MSYVQFCTRNKRHCKMGGASHIAATPAKMAMLTRVNNQVNRSIRPQEDPGDVWRVHVSAGDCEDYVLTKRARLLGKGVPASAMRIALARTRGGVGHAVLVVSTSKGDLVLDSRHDHIRPFHRTDLRWVKIQSRHNALLWYRV